MSQRLRRWLIGAPLATHVEEHERLTKTKALAVFSSDALSSVAYATDEILIALVIAGSAALATAPYIACAIVALIIIVSASYYQTIHAYPSGGGAFIVALENLGELPGLVAGSALLIDYILTVAVSVSAGTLAIVSAFPSLASHTEAIGISAIALVTWANLRGVRESGTLFAIGTYTFVAVFLLLIGTGLWRWSEGTLTPRPHSGVPAVLDELGILLILRAFASGCTALTGIEAMSNGVTAFRKPEAANASKTLLLMAALLAVMFLGSASLAFLLHITPVEGESVTSQLGEQIFGRGAMYYVLQGITAAILLLAANTAFAGFPRLASVLAQRGYLPRQLMSLGDRLVFSNGILALALIAMLLLIAFEGDTHRLIPLYAVGVFVSFTLSQAGMVRFWLRKRSKGWRWRVCLNGFGAATTALVLIVVLESKFIHGAWMVMLLLPALVCLFYAIHSHYRTFLRQITIENIDPEVWLSHHKEHDYKVIVPVSRPNQASLAAVQFARSISSDVRAVVVNLNPDETASLKQSWVDWKLPVPLDVIESPYRSISQPLIDFIKRIDREYPERGLAVVILPAIIPARWWQNVLHNQTALFLRAGLRRTGRGGQNRVIIEVPYLLRR